MSDNKPEPVVTPTRIIMQEIDNARKVIANAHHWSDDRVVTSVGGKTIWGALEVAIEKAVAAAVARREAEIVQLIRDAEIQRFAKCLLEDSNTVGVYFTAGELIEKIQNGGGA